MQGEGDAQLLLSPTPVDNTTSTAGLLKLPAPTHIITLIISVFSAGVGVAQLLLSPTPVDNITSTAGLLQLILFF